ncbi:hypothetical protein CC2G_013613 [Coprinopsis cinerea AmutBmut pab1-1]|nr:hypothetical protein CC2G_013613 [Coprinopsis cinerea AmutBmut pab1-1]KAG2008153.1 hypothetical protein CC2G_013613 [Coprinopsis cinerea AmutBmut pab1-1]
MFTPPPSPNPPRRQEKASSSSVPTTPLLESSPTRAEYLFHEEEKRRIGRRFRLLVLLVPIVLLAISATARFLATEGPSTYDLSSLTSSIRRHGLIKHRHSLHRRQSTDSDEEDDSSSSPSGSERPTPSGSAPSSSSTPRPSPVVPTIPDPAAPPTLPTPFIQAFDSRLPQNFSSNSCLAFFTNMTNTRPFRSCRPFSLLLQTSSTFISAQQNITLLNELVWGTCNTNTEESECLSNMAWFADSLQKECEADLKDGNLLATDTLLALKAYGLMREAACLSDPTTNTYCFINAARDLNPTNLYYYHLPLGLPIPPKSSDPQCTACLKDLMGLYGEALKSPGGPELLPGLEKTYESAAELTQGKCGVGYALTGLAGGASSVRVGGATIAVGAVVAGLMALLV